MKLCVFELAHDLVVPKHPFRANNRQSNSRLDNIEAQLADIVQLYFKRLKAVVAIGEGTVILQHDKPLFLFLHDFVFAFFKGFLIRQDIGRLECRPLLAMLLIGIHCFAQACNLIADVPSGRH